METWPGSPGGVKGFPSHPVTFAASPHPAPPALLHLSRLRHSAPSRAGQTSMAPGGHHRKDQRPQVTFSVPTPLPGTRVESLQKTAASAQGRGLGWEPRTTLQLGFHSAPLELRPCSDPLRRQPGRAGGRGSHRRPPLLPSPQLSRGRPCTWLK